MFEFTTSCFNPKYAFTSKCSVNKVRDNILLFKMNGRLVYSHSSPKSPMDSSYCHSAKPFSQTTRTKDSSRFLGSICRRPSHKMGRIGQALLSALTALEASLFAFFSNTCRSWAIERPASPLSVRASARHGGVRKRLQRGRLNRSSRSPRTRWAPAPAESFLDSPRLFPLEDRK